MITEELIKRFDMQPHEELGLIRVHTCSHTKEKRGSSGSIYYYVFPDLPTIFHKIDCDEYWAYTAGSSLQVWILEESGELRVERLGLCEGEVPMLKLEKGETFAFRTDKDVAEGTFFCAVTVPGFVEGSSVKLFTKEEMLELFPDAEGLEKFWEV